MEEPAGQLVENLFLEFTFLAFVGQGVVLSFHSLNPRLQVTIARMWEMTLSSAKENVFWKRFSNKIVDTGIGNGAGIAKMIDKGKLWGVHMKAKVDQFTTEVDCAQTVIGDFICACKRGQQRSFTREEENGTTSLTKVGQEGWQLANLRWCGKTDG